MNPAEIDPDRWARISALLDELLELPPAERQARLDGGCGGDEELRREVEALLEADDRAELFDGEVDTTRIGPWRLGPELGRGGMGAVFLAERADGQFEKRVALKVVKRGMDSDEVLRRFLAERQILARLDHPHIARLLDGGMTGDGRPYFAMELVEGVPLLGYCEQHRLGLEKRLGLLQDVCDAVQYAHRNLVVHRDIKPSNILVTADARVKLLDFGIAKLLGSEGGALTSTGERVMTPDYAAPEQLRGEPVTTATDVYALGLLLHELVTGRRLSRGNEPRIGQGDLQAILEKALRDEPERRYLSVEALREDARRFLDGLPVLARRGSLGYRARKFVRRHRAGMLAAAAVVLALGAGVAGMLWQARVAVREAAKAQAVKDFLVGVFEVSDPDKEKGEQITARELLDRGAGRIEQELRAQPEIGAELLTLVGRLHRKLGMYDRAAPLLERGLAIRRELHGANSLPVADSLSQLAELRTSMGKFDEAEPLWRQALGVHRRERGPADPASARDADGLARLLIERGRHDEAAVLIDETLDRIRSARGEENPEYATTLNARQMLFWAQGRYAEAEPVSRRVLEILLKLHGERNTQVAEEYSNLGTIAYARGDSAEAERMLRRAIDIGAALYGADHPSLGISYTNLGRALHELGRIEEAVAIQRRALAIRQEQLGQENPQLAVNLHNLALLLRERGEYPEAIALLQKAAAMNRQLLGDEHPSQAITFGALALVLHDAGRAAEAEPLFRRSLDAFRRRGLEKHMKFGDTLQGLGRLLVDTHRAPEAEPLLRDALQAQRSAFGEAAWRTAAAKADLARCLLALGQGPEARLLAQEALPVLQQARGEHFAQTRQLQELLAAR